jgi:hypothetical protein
MLEKEKYAKQQWRDYHRVRRAREYIAAGLKPPPPIFDDGVTLTDAEKLRKTEAQRKILRNKYGWADVDTGKI